MRFSICVIEPEGYKYSHFLYDVCKYFHHTLEAAGHECCMVRNVLYADRVNIIMGAHNLKDPAAVDHIRRSGRYVIVQSEVLREDAGWSNHESFNKVYVPLMRHADAVWEGLEQNRVQLRKLGLESDRMLNPFGYLRAMDEIVRKKKKDIDFLYYGSLTPHRKRLIEELKRRGGNVVCVFDDAAIFRNDLIARARVNLSLNQAPGVDHLTSKVLYLLNNRSIVVAERCSDQEWVEQCFLSADTDEWVDLCLETIQRPDLEELADGFFEKYRKVDRVSALAPLIEKLESPSRPKTPKKDILSLCMIVKNEERHLARCLSSVKAIVDEIIIVDTGSTDRTKELAASFGAKVYDFAWTDDFSTARNFSLSKATGSVILVLDADEVISEKDGSVIRSLMEEMARGTRAFSFTTRNYVAHANVAEWTQNDGTYGEEAGGGWVPSEKVRLFPNLPGIAFQNPVHEFVEPSLERAGIQVLRCGVPVHHYGKLDARKTDRKGAAYLALGVKKLEETGNDPKSIEELAIQAGGMGRYDEALALWERYIAVRPGDAVSYLNLSHIYVKLKKYDKAAGCAELAVKLAPEARDAYFNHAVALFCLGETERAVEVLERAMKKWPAYPLALGLLAVAHVASGRRDKGLQHLKMLAGMGFASSEYLRNTAEELHGMGRAAEALAILEAAADADLADDAVHRLIGEYRQLSGGAGDGITIIMYEAGNAEQVRECLSRLRRFTPEEHELIHLDKTPGTSLVKMINQAVRKASGNHIVLLASDALVTEGWLAGLKGRLMKDPGVGIAAPVTNRLVSADKDGRQITAASLDDFAARFTSRRGYFVKDAFELPADCMLIRGGLAEAVGTFDESLKNVRSAAMDFALRSAMKGYRNIISGGAYVLASAPEKSPSLKSYREKWSVMDIKTPAGKALLALKVMERADSLCRREKLDEAVKTYTEGIGHCPDNGALYTAAAERLVERNHFQQARDILERMPKAAESAKAQALLGYCEDGLGQPEKAAESADRSLSLKRDNSLAVNLKGVLAYGAGDRPAAAALFEQAIGTDPGYGESHTNLGVLTWAAGDREKALELLERGFFLSPSSYDAATHYHSALTATGAYERGEEAFREAKALYPDSQRILFLLVDLLLKQGRFAQSMPLIEDALVSFGVEEDILAAARAVREKLGPKEPGPDRSGTLSLCMIVKNEEKHIAPCLNSLKAVADEIIVVDTGSKDRTRDIAAVFGARIYDFPWNDDFSAARNLSLEKAKGEWVLVMDADEVIAARDVTTLRELIGRRTNKPRAYSINTRNYMRIMSVGWRENMGEYDEEKGTGWFPSEKVRLFPNDRRIRFQNKVHELVEPSLARLGIRIETIPVQVHHYGKLDAQKTGTKMVKYFELGMDKLKNNAADQKALYELAVQATELGRHDDAIGLWRRFLLNQPDHINAYLGLATAYGATGRLGESVEAARRGYELRPDMPEAVFNYALGLFYSGMREEAKKALEEFTTKDPQYPNTQGLLSLIYILRGENDGALDIIRKLRERGFDIGGFLQNQIRKLQTFGREKEAEALIKAALDLDLETARMLALSAEILIKKGPAEKAGIR